jgi:hypothetical protein
MRFKNRLFISLLLVAVLILSGCNLFKKPNGKIIGLVTMSDGKTPIKAKILVNGEQKVTAGDDGKFEISLKPGDYKLKAVYMEVESDETTVTVEPSKNKNVKITVDGLGKVTFALKTEDGKAIPNQAFKVGDEGFTSDSTGKTGESVVAYGTYNVTLNYKGFAFSKNLEIKSGENEIVVTGLKEISLTVKNTNGDAVPNAKATIKVGNFTEEQTTDADGKIKFIGVAGKGELTIDPTPPRMTLPDAAKEIIGTVAVDFASETKVEVNVDGDFVETFEAGLDKWIEEEDWELNKWQKTVKGATVQEGILKRTKYVASTTSGLKLKDVEIGDAIAVIRVRTTTERGDSVAGMRVHMRNDSYKFNKGYGANITTHNVVLENWLGEGGNKGATIQKNPPKSGYPGDGTWTTVTLILQGHTYKIYIDGRQVMVNPEAEDPEPLVLVETDETKQHTSGGFFIEFTGGLEIDEIRLYHL